MMLSSCQQLLLEYHPQQQKMRTLMMLWRVMTMGALSCSRQESLLVRSQNEASLWDAIAEYKSLNNSSSSVPGSLSPAVAAG